MSAESCCTSRSGEEPEPCSSGLSEKKELTVLYNVLESGCKIHEDTLKGIWQKASSLVANTSLVATVPGNSSSTYNHMLASSSSNCPHLVTTPLKFTGQFKCDSKCPMYATYKVCAHTVATAETTGKQKDFVLWLTKQKYAPNLTKLALHGIPKGTGEKGVFPRQLANENR